MNKVPVKVTEQDRRMAIDALDRALNQRLRDVDVIAEAIAWAREEGWRAAIDRITEPALRKAMERWR